MSNWYTLFAETFRDRRCLITGHTGFKGSWLTLLLRELGAELWGYALDPETSPNLFELAAIAQHIHDYRADVRDFDRLRSYVREIKPEFVFHLAAQPIVRRGYREPKYTFDTNVSGTVSILEALRDLPSVRAIVVITSDKCYENREWVYAYRETDPLGGNDPYSASKAAAEMVAHAYRISFFAPAGVGLATCRAGNVIGGGDWAEDRILPDAMRALVAGKPVPVRAPYSVRPWQHVLEALCGYLLVGAHLIADPLLGEAWNFGPAPESWRSVRELVSEFLTAYGTGTWTDVSASQGAAPHEAARLALAWDKAHVRLNWSPRWSFAKAVAITADWYRRQAAGEDARQLCLRDINEYLSSS